MTKRKEPEARTFAVVASVPIDLPGGREGHHGDQIELSDAEAAPLLADGHIVPTEPSLPEPVETL